MLTGVAQQNFRDPGGHGPVCRNCPYPGYHKIAFLDDGYPSNSHALLVSPNRRFARGSRVGVACASKYMDPYTGISNLGGSGIPV